MNIDMTYWCESCARKNNCYTIRSRPKCFVAITNTDRKTEPIEVYNGNADKENWQCITIKSIENESQINNDFKVTYTCSFTDCDNFKNFGFSEKCIECKRKQSEIKREAKPQTERPLPDYSYEADLGRRIMKQTERSE